MNKLYAEAREALAQNQRLILAPVGIKFDSQFERTF